MYYKASSQLPYWKFRQSCTIPSVSDGVFCGEFSWQKITITGISFGNISVIKGKMINWLYSLLNSHLHVESTPAENLLWEVWGWGNAEAEMSPVLSHGKGNAFLIIRTGRKILPVSPVYRWSTLVCCRACMTRKFIEETEYSSIHHYIWCPRSLIFI